MDDASDSLVTSGINPAVVSQSATAVRQEASPIRLILAAIAAVALVVVAYATRSTTRSTSTTRTSSRTTSTSAASRTCRASSPMRPRSAASARTRATGRWCRRRWRSTTRSPAASHPRQFHRTQIALLLLLGALLALFYDRGAARRRRRIGACGRRSVAATLFCVHTANTETMNFISRALGAALGPRRRRIVRRLHRVSAPSADRSAPVPMAHRRAGQGARGHVRAAAVRLRLALVAAASRPSRADARGARARRGRRWPSSSRVYVFVRRMDATAVDRRRRQPAGRTPGRSRSCGCTTRGCSCSRSA